MKGGTNIDSVNTRKPPTGYSDEQWQKDFSELKKLVVPSEHKRMPDVTEPPRQPGQIYFGKSAHQSHCEFINNILHNIRNGEEEYCFYVYQVAELLQFEQDLKARWLEDECAFLLLLKCNSKQ